MQLEIPCESCGAKLTFNPGTQSLKCQYCDHTMEIEGATDAAQEAQKEIDLLAYIDHEEQSEDQVEKHVVHCTGCGAENELAGNEQANQCPFCDTPIVIEQAKTVKKIKPKGLLPFKVERKEAKAAFNTWLSKLWFAPNKLKQQRTQHNAFEGVYLPYWTYDCDTSSLYSGKRGEHYYVTVQGTNSEGKSVSRQERRTRWYSAQGRVRCLFDDVLVPATESLPRDKLNALEPWDLPQLVDYQDQYLAGYRSETYHIGLKRGYGIAKKIMDGRIRDEVKRDIGGDEQVIHSVHTSYTDATFKHILLPVWVSAYRYQDKLYQILVNARTGEVQGERPWSWVKITFAVLGALAVGGLALWFYQKQQGG